MGPPLWTLARYRWSTDTGELARLRQHLASLPGRRFPRTVCSTSDLSLIVSYQGFHEGLTYVLPYLRDQMPAADTHEERAVTWRRMREIVNMPKDDLIVTGCSRERARRLPSPHSVILPFRIRMVLDLPRDGQDALSTVSRDEKRKFARLRRRHGWRYEVAAEPHELEFFYHRMYLPTMASRHGDDARSVDWEIAKHALFSRGVLVFATEQGRPVAGIMSRIEDDGTTMRMRMIGVLDADDAHYRRGAPKAAYFLTMEWAAENGVRRIDLGSGDPFPGKGVFQFKRLLHPAVAHVQDHFADRRIHLRVGRDTPAVRDFLAATPMITIDERARLTATYFADRIRPPRRDIRAGGPGIDDSRTIDLDQFLAGLPVAQTGDQAPESVPA